MVIRKINRSIMNKKLFVLVLLFLGSTHMAWTTYDFNFLLKYDSEKDEFIFDAYVEPHNASDEQKLIYRGASSGAVGFVRGLYIGMKTGSLSEYNVIAENTKKIKQDNETRKKNNALLAHAIANTIRQQKDLL